MIEINRNPTRRELRHFAGLWFPLFCALVGWMLRSRAHLPGVAWAVWTFGLGVAPVGLIAPSVFLGLSYATFPLGWVVFRVLLTVAFFLVFTSIGIILRLRGRDLMSRTFDPHAPTYWLARRHDRTVRNYFDQF